MILSCLFSHFQYSSTGVSLTSAWTNEHIYISCTCQKLLQVRQNMHKLKRNRFVMQEQIYYNLSSIFHKLYITLLGALVRDTPVYFLYNSTIKFPLLDTWFSI